MKQARLVERLKHLEAESASFEASGLDVAGYRRWKAECVELLRSSSAAECKPADIIYMIVPDESKATWGIPVCFGYGNEALDLCKQRKEAGLSSVMINPGFGNCGTYKSLDKLSEAFPAYIALNDAASPNARKCLAENQVFFGAPRMLELMEHGETAQIGTVHADFVRFALWV
jgi:hypothetical protein